RKACTGTSPTPGRCPRRGSSCASGMSMSGLRVVLDARPLSHPQAGGFRAYVRSLLRGVGERFADGCPDVELLLYVDRPLPSEVVASLPANATVRVLSNSRLKADFSLFRSAVREDKPDLVHGTMNYVPQNLSVPTTVTIHDALGLKRYPW